MKPVSWAFAIVLVVVFGAAAYRIVTSCEPSSVEFIKKLTVNLKGDCPKPTPVAAPTIPAPTVSAPNGVAIGRDMTGGSITQGAPAPAESPTGKSSTKASTP